MNVVKIELTPYASGEKLKGTQYKLSIYNGYSGRHQIDITAKEAKAINNFLKGGSLYDKVGTKGDS